MKNDERPILQKNRSVEQYYDTMSVESSTEMTGIMPTPPLSEAEEESYSELNGMPIPSDVPRNTKKRNK